MAVPNTVCAVLVACVVGVFGQPGYPTYRPTTTYKSLTYPTPYQYPTYSPYPTTKYPPNTPYYKTTYPPPYTPYYTSTYPPYTPYYKTTYPPPYTPYYKTTYPPLYTSTYTPSYTPYPSHPNVYSPNVYSPNVYPAPPQYKQNNDQKDKLDKLYARLEAVLDNLKFAEQEFQSLTARLSLQRKFFDEFTKITVVDLQNTDNKQDESIQGLFESADKANEESQNELLPSISQLRDLNRNNTNGALYVHTGIAVALARDVQQDAEINRLDALIRLVKASLIQVTINNCQVFFDAVARVSGRLDAAIAQEGGRQCEVGQVTLGAEDVLEIDAVEYQFQTSFDVVPGLVYGVCGFDFKLNDEEEYSSPYYPPYQPTYGGYNYGQGYSKEPNSLGFNVGADITKTGVSFRLEEQSFGSSATDSVDVCFQVCSIGPGRNDPVPYYN